MPKKTPLIVYVSFALFIITLIIFFLFYTMNKYTIKQSPLYNNNETEKEYNISKDTIFEDQIINNSINRSMNKSFFPLGIGGGGAMSGFSMSPYQQNLWFVGTDMGTLFRSTDQGDSWVPISDLQTTYGNDLENSAPIGFSADGKTLFHAPNGINPVKSNDSGITWNSIDFNNDVRIRYWISDNSYQNIIFAATNNGLFKTLDAGITWKHIPSLSGDSYGTFIDPESHIIYHATADGIYVSLDNGESFSLFHAADIRWFAGGSKNGKITLAYIDKNTLACSWHSACGFVWIQHDLGEFTQTHQVGGKQIAMAENNADVIYVVGDRSWPNAYGTKVFVSEDRGKSFTLKFNQLDWDVIPFQAWTQDRLDYSAVGVDIGWWDTGYYWFSVNQRNASMAGGSGNFFLHVTKDLGNHWLSPFTQFADTLPRTKAKKWKSTGLEVTSIRYLKFHPTHSKLGYATAADISGLVTEDGGDSWRIISPGYNSIYDFTFDPKDGTLVYAATGTQHDWPHGGAADLLLNGEGAIMESHDHGLSWNKTTNEKFNTQYLSLARDSLGTLYAGTQGKGIARKKLAGEWEWINQGLPIGDKIIPQIEINPKNDDIYLLLTGDKPQFTNQKETGIYKWSPDKKRWILLRGTVYAVTPNYLPWYYPTTFAIDFENNIFYLGDIENNGQWLATGIWRSDDEGKNWYRTLQFTFPYHITFDHNNSSRVYATGGYTVDGTWGNGGSYYSDDLGLTWKKNNEPIKQSNLNSVTLDPNNPDKIFYTYFGGGMTKNEKP